MLDDFDTPDDKFNAKIRQIPSAVVLGLQQDGKIASELTSTPCDEKQLKYAEKPIWFSKPGIDKFVKNHLNFTDSEWDRKYPSGVDKHEASICYKKVEKQIRKLRTDEKKPLEDWNSFVPTGVWRLSFSDSSVTNVPIEVEPNSETADEHDRNSPYWAASGSWKNWDHTLKNLPIRWGTKDENLWNKLEIKDFVFCSASSKSPKPFKKNGVFMVGKVTKKYRLEKDDGYFPDGQSEQTIELLDGESLSYQYRFEIEPLKIVENDNELLPYVNGIVVQKSINHITRNSVIKNMLTNLEDIWKINLNSDLEDTNMAELIVKDNYFVITMNPDSPYPEDIVGKQMGYDSWKSGSSELGKGSKFIVKSKIDNVTYFIGSGVIDEIKILPETVETLDNGKKRTKTPKIAIFQNYLEFKKKIIRQKSIYDKMQLGVYSDPDKPGRPRSIQSISKELYDEILRDDQPLPMLSSDDITSGYQKISDELLISEDTVSGIVVALLSGRHVLLAGAIGTGKTRLAKLIPEVFWSKWGGYYSEDYTATSDWSTQDVIGGIIPTMKDNDVQYVIQDGCVVDTVGKNWTSGRDGGRRTTTENPDSDTPFRGTWLVIDEFNRAEIDKAFGQLFTSLRTRKLKILTQQIRNLYANLQIPKDYRIIGTLNTKDKHFVFDLSDALKSRFAYIEVGIPKREQFETEMYYAMKNALYDLEPEYKFKKIIFNHNEKKIDEEQSDKEFYDKVLTAYHVLDTVRIFKKLGTAILKLIYQNLIVGDLLLSDSEKSLDDSLTLNLISQLEPESLSDLKLIRALLTDRLVSDLQPSSINTIEENNYFESLEKSFDYLQIQNKAKLLKNIKNNPSADMLGDFNQQYPITGNKIELTLEKWFSALDELIKSKKF